MEDCSRHGGRQPETHSITIYNMWTVSSLTSNHIWRWRRTAFSTLDKVWRMTVPIIEISWTIATPTRALVHYERPTWSQFVLGLSVDAADAGAAVWCDWNATSRHRDPQIGSSVIYEYDSVDTKPQNILITWSIWVYFIVMINARLFK
jgi:hypothetical protein